MVFEDENCLLRPDRVDSDTGDQRWHAIGCARLGPDSVVLLVVVHVYGTQIIRVVSARELITMTSEDIRKRPWTQAEKAAVRRAAARQAPGIDPPPSDDFPPLTPEQLAHTIRFRDRPRKVAVSVRLDSEVLDWLRSKGEGRLW